MKSIALAAALLMSVPAAAQDLSDLTDEAVKQDLAEHGVVESLVMVPMRDGASLATSIYRPKGAKGPLPTILWKTPYNEVGDRPRTNRAALKAVKRGYAYDRPERARPLFLGRQVSRSSAIRGPTAMTR